jgi:lipopolysaccharide export system protein LptA
VYLKDGAIDKLIATGQPSKFKQLPAVGKDEMFGEGLTNEFYPDKNLLIFMKNASVWQGDAKQSSDYIQYDTKNSVLKAGEPSTDGKRVHSVIKPKTQTQPAQKAQ